MIMSYSNLVRYQAEFSRHSLRAALSVAEWYVSLLDPRPDLAIPARSVKSRYTWWW